MICPVCGTAGCHYWELRRTETWHPAAAPAQPGMPPEYLKPIWRHRPDRHGPAAIALDPREALYVLANGATLDGSSYRASLDGWDGTVELDGRVTVRIVPIDELAA